MFCTPSQTLTARVRHICTYCGQTIEPGETYKRWASVDDGWFTNKMHPECLESLQEEDWDTNGGQFEYTLYEGERPERVQQP